MSRRSRGENNLLPAGIFSLSFLSCTVFVFFMGPLPVTDDAQEYFRIARNVSLGLGFTEDGSTPCVYRPPLFASLLGLWFYLTGARTVLAACIYQSLCTGLSAAASYFLFREIFRDRVACVPPAVILAVHPSIVTLCVLLYQEPTILLITTLACWMTARWLNGLGMGKAVGAGACWGVAALGKAVTLFVPALLVLLWFWRGRREDRMKGGQALLAVMAFLMVIAPWTARNYHHFHRFIPVNAQGAGLLEWNVQHSDAPVDEGKGWAGSLFAQLGTKDATKGELAGEKVLAELNREGVKGKERTTHLWNYIFSHKKYFFVQRVRNAIFFAAPGVDWWIQSGRLKTGEAQRSAPFLLFALLFHGIFYIFFFWRLLLLARGKLDLPMTFLVLFFALYWGTYTLLWGEIRYAIPVYPVLVMFAPWEWIFPTGDNGFLLLLDKKVLHSEQIP